MHAHPISRLRIAQVSPLHESVPPKTYGGTERVVSWLTEELVRQGHQVTLFASGDSRTAARLVAGSPRGLRLDACRDMSPEMRSLIAHVIQFDQVMALAGDFDIIHFHTEPLQHGVFRHLPVPTLTTLHGRLDLPELAILYRAFPDLPVVSISNDQRRPLPHLNWISTVYHGLPPDLLALDERGGDYLVFLGRISPEKRPDRAIEIARRAGVPLKIAAKVDAKDKEYFEREIEHLMRQDGVEYVGEVADADKQALLGGARGLLFPIDWPEPFGLVMIEAMACGTPVIAWKCGSVPEVIDAGESGFVVDSIDAAVEAVHALPRLTRRACREAFDRRFTAASMAHRYVSLYQGLIQALPRSAMGAA